ncbi:MAG: nitrate- and nitrite sensing domain-containing protein [Spirochaetales bacterium]|nr:nitrate- and nitrite sensing domain-containing protein [Spirochaetales bacterium]
MLPRLFARLQLPFRLSIKYKISLLLLPLFALGALLTVPEIQKRILESRRMHELQKMSGAVTLVSDLIHSLQRERGLSSGFLLNQENRSLLEQERFQTDTRLRVLHLFLSDPEVGGAVRGHRDRLLELLNQRFELEKLRSDISRKKVTVEETYRFYTAFIQRFSRIVEALPSGSQSSRLNSLINAQIVLMRIKESLGQERAQGYADILRGNRDASAPLGLIAQRQSYSFLLHMLLEQGGLTELASQAKDALTENRAIYIEAQLLSHPESVSADAWWNAFTDLSDNLKRIEQKLLQHLSRSSLELAAAARTELMVFSAFIATLLVLWAAIILLIHRLLIIPLEELSRAMDKRTADHLSEKHSSRHDEIGSLYQHFASMQERIFQARHNLESEVAARTKELSSITTLLSKYLAPQLFNQIFTGKHAILSEHRRVQLTVFFSDIVGFTRMTERVDPEITKDILNTYLDEMCRIALKWGGTIDKFIGDAIMVFFGDPEFTTDKDHALRCTRMALEMRDRLSTLNDEFQNRGLPAQLSVRMGMNTGYCTVGNFGSEHRLDYTAIGSQVNTANRIQGSAEPGKICISLSTYLLIKDDFECLPLGEFQYKGIASPIEVYEVIRSKDARERFLLQGDGFRIELDGVAMDQTTKSSARRALKKAYRLVATPEELERLKSRPG